MAHTPIGNGNHMVIDVLIGTRVHRIDRIMNGWRVWIASRDYKLGTYITLNNDGSATTTTSRVDEGDEIIQIRPSDATIEQLSEDQQQ